MAVLLPRDALASVRGGISISDSPDLARLGLTDTHLRLALGEVARAVLVGGGKLAYGGHLEPTGFTAFLAGELQRYGQRKDRPLLVCRSPRSFRRASRSASFSSDGSARPARRNRLLDAGGNEVDPALDLGEDPVPVADAGLKAKALTGLRRYMGTRAQGRVVIGGKRHDFEGALPGLMEEVLIALTDPDPQPVYLAARFRRRHGEHRQSARRRRSVVASGRRGCARGWPAAGRRPAAARAAQESPGWSGLNNGLSSDENRRLAATHRPSEIASLVGLGLGRRFAVTPQAGVRRRSGSRAAVAAGYKLVLGRFNYRVRPMQLKKLLEKWDLTSLQIKTPFLEMEWQPRDEDKNAAWELYVELITRAATQHLDPDEGDEAAALRSIYDLFALTRDTIKRNGRHCINFTRIAVVVLNQKVRPFTARWHPRTLAGSLAARLRARQLGREVTAGEYFPECRCTPVQSICTGRRHRHPGRADAR